MKTKLLLIIAIVALHSSHAQIGGRNSFALLNMQFNARSASLGGDFISVMDKDINIGINNPSLLNAEMSNTLGLNHAYHAGGINYGMVNYAFQYKELGTASAYIKYADYGKFQRTAINGIEEGEFNPFEMISGVGFGKRINPRISVGGNAYLLYSQLESYSSLGMGIDLSGSFINEEKGFLFTALVKNAGMQLKNYTTSDKVPLPAEFQMAASYKLPHAPFRFSVLMHHLNKWDLSYNDPNAKPTIDALTGDTIAVPQAGFVDKLSRHFTIQTELLLSKNIHIRMGFDYNRRKELMLEQRPGLAGFSVGTGLYFSKFSLDYGFVIYSGAGFNNLLTFSTNLSKWRR